MTSVPARATRRGGVRSRSISNPVAPAPALSPSSAARIFAAPLTVWTRQVKARRSRQCESGRNSASSDCLSGARRAFSNSASQRLTVENKASSARLGMPSASIDPITAQA